MATNCPLNSQKLKLGAMVIFSIVVRFQLTYPITFNSFSWYKGRTVPNLLADASTCRMNSKVYPKSLGILKFESLLVRVKVCLTSLDDVASR